MRKRRILIVADDAALAGQSASTLRDSGLYDVLVEHESADALEVARHFQPRVILVDLDAPRQRPRVFADEAAGDPFLCHVPILFVTALLNGVKNDFGLLPSGGRRLLAKPINAECLLQSVATFAGTA